MGAKYSYQSKKFKDVSLPIKHAKNLVPRILDTIRNHDPDIFIELGTFQGGMTLAVHEEFPELKICSFDRRRQDSDESLSRIFKSNVKFFYGDILKLSEEDRISPYFENAFDQNNFLIEMLTNESGKIFLYCDNGNKVKEMNLYSRYLKIGDIIGCHDWMSEIFPHQIEEAIKDFKLLEDWAEKYQSRFWIKVR